MLSRILKAMTDAISVLSVLEKTYIACCVSLVLVDTLGGFTPEIFQIGFIVLIGALVPVLLLAKKTQKNVSAILSGILLLSIYTLGQGYLTA
jgi:hypothetical protein